MTTGRILVGVDGSAGSRRALRWAVEEAARRGAFIDALIAWGTPYDFAGDLHYVRRDEQMIAEFVRALLTETIAGVAGNSPNVEIHPIVIEGDPAETLCAWSADSDLLVVGSRGVGGFTRLALGSVSDKCAHHSRCPVVIVPKDYEDHVEQG